MRSKKRNTITALSVALLIIFIAIHYSTTSDRKSADSASREKVVKYDENEIQQAPKGTYRKITHPDYLENPSGYIIDYDSRISESIPEGQMLWVEDAFYDHNLLVSYTGEKLGTKYIGLGVLQIPSLGYPVGYYNVDEDHLGQNTESLLEWKESESGRCWRRGTRDFLFENFTHRRIYIESLFQGESKIATESSGFDHFIESYRILITLPDAEREDLSAFLVWNGYAVPTQEESSYVASNDKDIFQVKQKYRNELKDMEEVAALSKRGLWATCNI